MRNQQILTCHNSAGKNSKKNLVNNVELKSKQSQKIIERDSHQKQPTLAQTIPKNGPIDENSNAFPKQQIRQSVSQQMNRKQTLKQKQY